MDDNQLLRYSRQIMLPQIGIEGQQKLLNSRALIIGLGGLGSPVAMYLASAGVGHLTLVDDDVVDLSNLQRQILHAQYDIGKNKVDSAQDTLLALNPDISITTFGTRLDDKTLSQQVQQADIVLDATDNFSTRFKINRACVQNRTPLVSGAAIRTEGQVAVFRPELGDSPCYRCLYKDEGELDETCTENGVLAPLVGIIGSIQAMEAIKVLLEIGDSLCGRLLVLDGMAMEWRTMKLNKDPDCPICGQ